jgi:uracil-DNA glycosylase
VHRAKLPREKSVMIISDYPIVNEVERDIPYSGASNLTLLSDLYKVGVKQSFCALTYLSYGRPSKESYDWRMDFRKHKNVDDFSKWFKLEHQKDIYVSDTLWNEFQGLLKEIELVKPKIIILAGKWSFFFLTGKISYLKTQGNFKNQKPLGGLNSYRASIMQSWEGFNFPKCIVFPILPAVTKQRSPEKIPIMKWDFRKLGDIYKKIIDEEVNLDFYLKPNRELIIGDSLINIRNYLLNLIEKLDYEVTLVSTDIETRHNTIDCIGIAYEKIKAICIPFSTIDNPNFWTFEEELEIHLLLLKVFQHKNFRNLGQNFSYDSQYLYKFWLINVNTEIDTMILHHCLYNTMPKSLDFLASIYSETYCQWKDMQNHGKFDG